MMKDEEVIILPSAEVIPEWDLEVAYLRNEVVDLRNEVERLRQVVEGGNSG